MKIVNMIAAICIAVCMMSCGTHYRMVTTLERDGSAVREVYANGDSAFMAGNMLHNPYLFDIGSGWDIARYDADTKYDFFGDKKNMNVKVSKRSSSIELFSNELNYNEENRALAAPEETLTKKFRWFYTHFIFKGVYKKLSYHAPVSIDKYLSKEEQKLWSQGDFSNYPIMNGAEMNDMLSGMEEKFMNWAARNFFEISIAGIQKLSKEYLISDAEKEEIYKQLSEKEEGLDIDPRRVCNALDKYYQTNYFSELYKQHETLLDKAFEKEAAVTQIGNIISYELVVPGLITHTNSPIVNNNSITWKVDGMRILFHDYTLTAEYRIANTWAFLVSALILIIAIASITLLVRKKERFSRK